MARLSVVALSAGLLAGCQAAVIPVPVQGTVDQLVGEWSGEYSSLETGRRGSILFHLDPGRDTATGDVLMTPDQMRGMPTVPDRAGELWRTSSQVLQISFVRCTDGEVNGWMKPYTDPDSGELIYTDFTGYITGAAGDTLKGTYVSRVEKIGKRTGGTWIVVRVRR